ncbi:conserved membrane protein of unknown function (plasmid) [Cupriavidus taiwanensis]|uniref:Protein MgtC n=1 Tax=Cupriavidus taiwanensis TaxID=164546 RepID=A0A375I7T8_9BURK|nr:MgtC/SapB family protein [Cupriavidus taiwanensis]SPK70168.1 conserved membrane hypothetical protein [Cupriavidus taiwanensis]SPK77701.1 conserved membrane protein of unknown function [Cupriavidus taiwanensis]
MEWHQFLVRLAIALALGAVIGAERQLRQRMAGLRTNALVATGGALYVMVAAYLPGADSAARVASYVVSRVGFLGAGVIMRDGGNVRGLNTAATLWCAAAPGMLCGIGLLWQAAAGAAAVLGANVVLRGIAHQINRQDVATAIDIEQTYRVAVVCRSQDEVHARTLMLHMLNGMPQLMVQSLHSEDLPESGRIEVRADLIATPSQHLQLEQIVSRLRVANKTMSSNGA